MVDDTLGPDQVVVHSSVDADDSHWSVSVNSVLGGVEEELQGKYRCVAVNPPDYHRTSLSYI